MYRTAERVLVEHVESGGRSFARTDVGKKYIELKSTLEREMEASIENSVPEDSGTSDKQSSAQASEHLPTTSASSSTTSVNEKGANGKAYKKQRSA